MDVTIPSEAERRDCVALDGEAVDVVETELGEIAGGDQPGRAAFGSGT